MDFFFAFASFFSLNIALKYYLTAVGFGALSNVVLGTRASSPLVSALRRRGGQ